MPRKAQRELKVFWDVHPPDSSGCLEFAQIFLRARINSLHKLVRYAFRDYVKIAKLKPPPIPNSARRRIYQKAFKAIIDSIRNDDWPHDPQGLRVPESQAGRLPTMSHDDEHHLRETGLSPKTTMKSIHADHGAWCEMEPRTMTEYLNYADLIAELTAKKKRNRKDKPVQPQGNRSSEERNLFKHSLETKYADKDLETIYGLYELWLKSPRSREAYVDHANVVCDIEARQGPLDLTSSLKSRNRLFHWYGEMGIEKMRREHRRWCQEDVHLNQEYIDHAVVIAELGHLDQDPGLQAKPEDVFEKALEQSADFKQTFWNRYQDKPLEDIYWDREHWLRKSPHTLQEYKDHLQTIHEMERRQVQPKLSVDGPSEYRGEPPSKRRRVIRSSSPQKQKRGPKTSSVERASRRTATNEFKSPAKPDGKLLTGDRSRRTTITPKKLQGESTVQKSRKLPKEPIGTPAPSRSGKQRRSPKTRSASPAVPTLPRPDKRSNLQMPQDERRDPEFGERNTVDPKAAQPTSFKSPLVDKDGWRWYSDTEPSLPIPETRYIAALMDVQTKLALTLGPGKVDESKEDFERRAAIVEASQRIVKHENLKSKFPLPKIPESLKIDALRAGFELPEDD
ncbi:MAG: hypothetical protein M1821_009705 [Bathelium mastoideum]|nr:MAG: hypothetical protein M1821_009705 [Bathelium mastoideum]